MVKIAVDSDSGKFIKIYEFKNTPGFFSCVHIGNENLAFVLHMNKVRPLNRLEKVLFKASYGEDYNIDIEELYYERFNYNDN